MTTKVVPGLLIATQDKETAAREAFGRMLKAIQDAIRDRGTASIALSGGSSPIDAYALLAKEIIDWNKVHIYWVDERAVPADSPRSNYGQAKKALLDPAAIPPANIHRMKGDMPDLDAAAKEYEAELRDTVKNKLGGLPSLDLLVMGIGDDGHTASLFPGNREQYITDRLVAAVAQKGDREARLTLTVPILENARASVIIVMGKDKHPALERIWSTSGTIDETPGRIIRNFRGSITWVIDRAAGGMG